jgi:hypothetical protein
MPVSLGVVPRSGGAAFPSRVSRWRSVRLRRTPSSGLAMNPFSRGLLFTAELVRWLRRKIGDPPANCLRSCELVGTLITIIRRPLPKGVSNAAAAS